MCFDTLCSEFNQTSVEGYSIFHFDAKKCIILQFFLFQFASKLL